jgi:hypothetical protein
MKSAMCGGLELGGTAAVHRAMRQIQAEISRGWVALTLGMKRMGRSESEEGGREWNSTGAPGVEYTEQKGNGWDAEHRS